MMKTYEIKTTGGATYTIEAEDLLDLFKVIRLTFMLELGIPFNEFKSIEQKD